MVHEDDNDLGITTTYTAEAMITGGTGDRHPQTRHDNKNNVV